MYLTIMAKDTIQGLKAQVPSGPPALHLFQELHALKVVVEIPDARRSAQFGQKSFPVVSERGVTDIMPQGDRFDEVLVELQKAADGAGDLGDQLDVQHPVGDVIVADQGEHLGLVDVAGVGAGMKDAVGIH